MNNNSKKTTNNSKKSARESSILTLENSTLDSVLKISTWELMKKIEKGKREQRGNHIFLHKIDIGSYLSLHFYQKKNKSKEMEQIHSKKRKQAD